MYTGGKNLFGDVPVRHKHRTVRSRGLQDGNLTLILYICAVELSTTFNLSLFSLSFPLFYIKLYNATVDTLPYMFLVMTSLLYAIAMVGHAFLNSKKALLNQQKKEEDAKEAEKGESSKEVAEKAL